MNQVTVRTSSLRKLVRTPSSSACYHHYLHHFAKGRPRVILYGRSPEHHDFFDRNGDGDMLAIRTFGQNNFNMRSFLGFDLKGTTFS